MTSLSKFSWKTSPRDSAVAESRVEEIHNFLFEEISYEMRFWEVVRARNATFCHTKCVSKARCLDLCERACCGGSVERFDHARIVFLVAGRFFAQILTLHLFQGISQGCIVFKPLPCVAVAFFSLCTVNCHFFWLKFYVSVFFCRRRSVWCTLALTRLRNRARDRVLWSRTVSPILLKACFLHLLGCVCAIAIRVLFSVFVSQVQHFGSLFRVTFIWKGKIIVVLPGLSRIQCCGLLCLAGVGLSESVSSDCLVLHVE